MKDHSLRNTQSPTDSGPTNTKVPQAPGRMPLTPGELESIRADWFADDVMVPPHATEWSRDDAINFFESGGRHTPCNRMPPSPVRLLCLHGGGSNQQIMMLQTARLRRAMGASNVQLEFLEGTREQPRERVEKALLSLTGPDARFFSWYGVENDSMAAAADDPVAYVAALSDASVSFRYVEAEAALDRLEGHIARNGPYDGLVGFSQGGVMVTMLTARLLERARRGEGSPPAWRCNILISSLPPRIWMSAASCTPPCAGFPAVSTIGRNDPFYAYAKAHLPPCYDDDLIWLEHDGTHAAPAAGGATEMLAAAVWRALGSGSAPSK